MAVNPLSYASLKTVLRYMEANIRFQLSRRIPSIRTAEKSVPLTIDLLILNNLDLTVNEIKYQFTVCQKYHNKEVPGWLRGKHELGVEWDIDQFGVIENLSTVLMPGDVMIGNQEDEELDVNAHIEVHEQSIADLERRIETDGPAIGESFVQMLSRSITSKKFDLLPYYRRRDNNTQVPYDSYIQLITTKQNRGHVERVKYDKKLYNAMKYLNHTLFGNRRHSVQVKHLYIPTFDRMILRLPLGLKFHVREMRSFENVTTVYEALKPIMDDSAYPLELLEMGIFFGPVQDYTQPIIRTAKRLRIFNVSQNSMTEIVLNLVNREVHLVYDCKTFGSEDRILLIRKWLDTSREIGTCFLFGINEEKRAKELLELVKQRFNGAVLGKRCVTIPMTSTAQLDVSYGLDKNPSKWYDRVKNEPWLLKIEVVDVQSKDPIT